MTSDAPHVTLGAGHETYDLNALKALPKGHYVAFNDWAEAETKFPGIRGLVDSGKVEVFTISTFEEDAIGFRIPAETTAKEGMFSLSAIVFRLFGLSLPTR